MKKAMLVDAIGMLDQAILADFYEMDAALDHVPVVKKKVKTIKLLIIAGCIALAISVLLVSLPFALVVNRERIEKTIQENSQTISQEIINNNIMNFNIRYSKTNK